MLTAGAVGAVMLAAGGLLLTLQARRAAPPTPPALSAALPLPPYIDGPLPPGLPEPTTGAPASPDELQGLLALHAEGLTRRPSDVGLRVRTIALELALDLPDAALRDALEAPAHDPRLAFLEAGSRLRGAPRVDDPLDEEDQLRRATRALAPLRALSAFRLPADVLRARIACRLGEAGPADSLLAFVPASAEGWRARLQAAALQTGLGNRTAWRDQFVLRESSADTAAMRALARGWQLNFVRCLQADLDTAWNRTFAEDLAARDSIVARVRRLAGELGTPAGLCNGVLSEADQLVAFPRAQLPRARRLDATFRRLIELINPPAGKVPSAASYDSVLVLTPAALADAAALGWKRRAFDLHWARAMALDGLDRPADALDEARAMGALARAANDPAMAWATARWVHSAASNIGRLQEALDALADLQRLDAAWQFDAATVSRGNGFLRFQLGDLRGAFEYWALGYRDARRQGAVDAIVSNLENLAFASLALGRPQKAMAYAGEAIETAQGPRAQRLPPNRKKSVHTTAAYARVDLGVAVAQQPGGDLAPLRAAIDTCEASPVGRAAVEGRMILARLLSARGAQAQAQSEAAQARARAEAVDAADLVWRATAVHGEVCAASGRVQEAAADFEHALGEVEALRGSLVKRDERTVLLLSARELADRYIALEADGLKDAAAAYVIDERSREHRLREQAGPAAAAAPWQSERARTLDEVANTLRDGGLLVQFRVEDSRVRLWAATRRERTAATVTIAKVELDSLVTEWLAAIEGGSSSSIAGILGDRLLGPIATWVEPARDLVIVPDGALCRVPFALLRLDGRRLLEDHVVRYGISGTTQVSLAQRRAGKGGRTTTVAPRVLAVGYGGSWGEGGEGTPAAPRATAAPMLPFAEREVAAVAALAPGSVLLTGTLACPSRTLTALPRATHLHIAAHSGVDLVGRPFLLLASDPARLGGGDGAAGGAGGGGNGAGGVRVTAQEIARWPLAGVRLVTLSACSTAPAPGDGRVLATGAASRATGASAMSAAGAAGAPDLELATTAGGVTGLGAAIFLGGAGALIASLWDVEDASTLDLMQLLYASLLTEGADPAEALRTAQLQLARRDSPPLPERAWGAFCAYGP
jgi:CHAT domain-containing protein